MWEKLFIAFAGAIVGAIVALLIKEGRERLKLKSKGKKIAKVCSGHLEQIRQDLSDHVKVTNGNATFGETQYCEAVVGDFLYNLITSHIECFPAMDSFKRTLSFFHHYKVNMTTVRSRLDDGKSSTAQLTEATYKDLLEYLNGAIEELNSIAGA